MTEWVQLSDLPSVKYFGVPVSVARFREESLPQVSVTKGCTSLL